MWVWRATLFPLTARRGKEETLQVLLWIFKRAS
jgi:hypothetical protein